MFVEMWGIINKEGFFERRAYRNGGDQWGWDTETHTLHHALYDQFGHSGFAKAETPAKFLNPVFVRIWGKIPGSGIKNPQSTFANHKEVPYWHVEPTMGWVSYMMPDAEAATDFACGWDSGQGIYTATKAVYEIYAVSAASS
jgi:hypothetical protein